MIQEYKSGDELDLKAGIIVRMGDREYQALPSSPKGSCKGCFGAKDDGIAVQAICMSLPDHCSKMVEGQEGNIPEINVIWVDVTDVPY